MRAIFSSALMAMTVLVLSSCTALAQDRPSSPRGETATQIGGAYDDGDYEGGSWVAIDYSRPILRGRTEMFGSGDSYGTSVSGNGPVWRAGANKSTRLMTETDLMFGDNPLPAGEYSLFIELVSESEWMLILSNHQAQAQSGEGEGIWGAYGYSADMDVFRTAMSVSEAPFTFDQLTFSFVNMTQEGGTLALMWDNTLATVDFSVAR